MQVFLSKICHLFYSFLFSGAISNLVFYVSGLFLSKKRRQKVVNLQGIWTASAQYFSRDVLSQLYYVSQQLVLTF